MKDTKTLLSSYFRNDFSIIFWYKKTNDFKNPTSAKFSFRGKNYYVITSYPAYIALTTLFLGVIHKPRGQIFELFDPPPLPFPHDL